MGIYRDHVLPRLVDAACGSAAVAPLRARVCAGLSGDVVEIGFGSGRNVPFYPDGVTRVDAVEPVDAAWRLAGARLAAAGVAVRRTGLDGQRLPFGDDTFDQALSTWTLCTIPDPHAALSELRRVLKPGGFLRFVEHGLAPDESVRRLQRRFEPAQRLLAGGCHLTRPVAGMLAAAGFDVVELEEFYQPGVPRFESAFSLGMAASP
jgi:SAM-dependent methyltransferase